MSNENSMDAIVLDAGPILQNSPSVSSLLSKSKKIFTSPSIIAEIKDVNARQRLETTLSPFLIIKTPSPLSIKFVTQFARKTGDLAVLSRADVEILSLAYELEQEKSDRGELNDDSREPGECTVADNAAISLRLRQASPAPASKPNPVKVSDSTPAAPWAPAKTLTSKIEGSHCDSAEGDEQIDLGKDTPSALEEPMGEIEKLLDSISIQTQSKGEYHSSPVNPEEPSEIASPVLELEDSDSENSEGWITPANIKRVQAAENDKSSSKSSVKPPIRMAIITTDFAMQNVILQIGLNLLSPNLNRISNIRTYILRCHACFQNVKDTSKQFCPRCGKPTLTRVSCSTNAKGEFRIHLKKSMQWNHRGDRYSIPKPVPGQANGKVGKGKGGGKGGWGQGLLLAEDQKEYQRAVGSNGRSKGIDLMDEDYLPGILTGNRGRPGGRPKIGAGRNVNSKKRV